MRSTTDLADALEALVEAVLAPLRRAVEALWEVVRDVLAPAFRRLLEALDALDLHKRKPLIHNGKKPKNDRSRYLLPALHRYRRRRR